MKITVVSHPCVTPANQALYAELVRVTGWHVTLVVPSRWRTEYGERSAERWHAFGGDLVALPVIAAGNIPLHIYTHGLRRALRDSRPDAIFMHHEAYGLATAQACQAARRAGIPFGFYSSQNLVKRYPWPMRELEHRVYDASAFAVAATESVGSVIEAKGFQGPIDVVPMLGVDAHRFRPTTDREDGAFVVGYVGRLSREKGVDLLLDAAADLQDTDIALRIAGEGPERDALRAHANRLGIADRVTWLGYVPHERAETAYASVDLLAVPSRRIPGWSEQFGRVVVEAWACGVPVIASESGELPHLVRGNGGGWVFPEGDAAALATQLRRLSAQRDQVASVGKAARESVIAKYSLTHAAEMLASTLERGARST